MINMPYEMIEEKVVAASGITKEEFAEKVKAKMEQLSGLISKEGAAYIIANELGVKLLQTEGLIKIKNIISGMRSVETAGKVIRKFPVNEFERNGAIGRVASFIIADETGQIRVTAWHNATAMLENFKEGDVVKVVNGYVRENNGKREIHLNDKSRISVNPDGISLDNISVKQEIKSKNRFIKELTENDSDVSLFGTIVQVFDPRYYEVCPLCNKRLSEADGKFSCPEHGNIENPAINYVVNAVIDDGTDNIRVVFFKNQANNLFKKTEEEMLSYRNDIAMLDTIKTELLGEQIKITGRASKNEMFDRLEFIARFVERDINVEEELEKMKKHEENEEIKESEKADNIHVQAQDEDNKDENPAAVDTGYSSSENKEAAEKSNETESIKEDFVEDIFDSETESSEKKDSFHETNENESSSCNLEKKEKESVLPSVDEL